MKFKMDFKLDKSSSEIDQEASHFHYLLCNDKLKEFTKLIDEVSTFAFEHRNDPEFLYVANRELSVMKIQFDDFVNRESHFDADPAFKQIQDSMTQTFDEINTYEEIIDLQEQKEDQEFFNDVLESLGPVPDDTEIEADDPTQMMDIQEQNINDIEL